MASLQKIKVKVRAIPQATIEYGTEKNIMAHGGFNGVKVRLTITRTCDDNPEVIDTTFKEMVKSVESKVEKALLHSLNNHKTFINKNGA
jgi:hypothetical protein